MLGRNVETFSFVLPFLPSTKKGVFFFSGKNWSHVDEQHVPVPLKNNNQAAFSNWLVSLSPMERTTKTTRESGRTQGTIRKLFQAGAILVWFLADCSGCLAVFGYFDTSADRILESVWHATFNIKPHLWSVWIDVELTHRQRYRSCWPYVGSPKSGDFDFSTWGVEIRTEQYDVFFSFLQWYLYVFVKSCWWWCIMILDCGSVDDYDEGACDGEWWTRKDVWWCVVVCDDV